MERFEQRFTAANVYKFFYTNGFFARFFLFLGFLDQNLAVFDQCCPPRSLRLTLPLAAAPWPWSQRGHLGPGRWSQRGRRGPGRSMP